MAQADPAPETQRRGRGLITFLRDLVVIVLIAFLISFLLKTFLVRSFYIPSGSMQHTLEIDDRILVNQLVPQVVGVQRGDIVVFQDLGGWMNLPQGVAPEPTLLQKALQTVGLSADTSTDYVVKRVIGIGGDRVVCCDESGRVTVNGVPLDEEYVVLPQEQSLASAIEFDVTVPEGSVWVMGDNRYNSMDSRYHQDEPGRGFVPESEIVGRAFALYWPFDRAGLLSNHSEVFVGVEEAQTPVG